MMEATADPPADQATEPQTEARPAPDAAAANETAEANPPAATEANGKTGEDRKTTAQAKQIAGRIHDLMPEWDGTADRVAGWPAEDRAAVLAFLDNPPDDLSSISESDAERILTFSVAADLSWKILRHRLDNATRRDGILREAEKRLAKEQAKLNRLNDEKKALGERIKKQEGLRDAAVHELRMRVRDQVIGQNVLPMDDEYPPDANPDGSQPEKEPRPEASDGKPAPAGIDDGLSNDPAARNPVSDLLEYGLTETIVNKFIDVGFGRIEDVRAWINVDKPKPIIGLGPAKHEKIRDALNAWRAANPVKA